MKTLACLCRTVLSSLYLEVLRTLTADATGNTRCAGVAGFWGFDGFEASHWGRVWVGGKGVKQYREGRQGGGVLLMDKVRVVRYEETSRPCHPAALGYHCRPTNVAGVEPYWATKG